MTDNSPVVSPTNAALLPSSNVVVVCNLNEGRASALYDPEKRTLTLSVGSSTAEIQLSNFRGTMVLTDNSFDYGGTITYKVKDEKLDLLDKEVLVGTLTVTSDYSPKKHFWRLGVDAREFSHSTSECYKYCDGRWKKVI